jgi:hypothetical protein
MQSLRSQPWHRTWAEYDPRRKFNFVPNKKKLFDRRVTSTVAAAVGKHSNSVLKLSLLSAGLMAR